MYARADIENGLVVGYDILCARVDRELHYLLFVYILCVNKDNALTGEHEHNRALLTHVSAVFVEIMTDIARGAVAVIGKRFNNHGNAVGAVALVYDFLVIRAAAFARRLLYNAVDIIVGDIGCLRLGNDIFEL